MIGERNMDNVNKKSLSYKIQKNPFLIGLGLLIAVIVLIAVVSLSTAVKNKVKKISETTTAPVTAAAVSTTSAPDFTVDLPDLKTYVNTIKSTEITYENNRAVITVKFESPEALLEAHYAKSIVSLDVQPVFHFFINHGTEVKCPGEMKLLDDGVTVQYYISEIDDLKNVVAITDEMTLTYQNILTMGFDLYVTYTGDKASGTNPGRTVLGTYFKSIEELRADSAEEKTPYTGAAKGIKNVELTASEKFAWLDIYFTGEEAYNSLNYSFQNNFIGFKFETGGKKFDTLFTTTKYDDIYMIRCKFDFYALTQMIKDTGDKDMTITELFSDKLSVFSSDYDTEKSLFTLN